MDWEVHRLWEKIRELEKENEALAEELDRQEREIEELKKAKEE